MQIAMLGPLTASSFGMIASLLRNKPRATLGDSPTSHSLQALWYGGSSFPKAGSWPGVIMTGP